MANILVVEDDIDIASGVAEYFSDKEYILDFAYNGKQALNLISEHDYDLILLDLNLPYVNGLDVCKTLLKEHLTTVPVVIMSAYSEEKDILAGFSSGAWDYLAKPFSFAELSARVTACLAKSNQVSKQQRKLENNGICLNHDDLSISYNGSKLQLHQVGFDLLKVLLEKSPNTVKTPYIHKALWQEETPESDPLRAHVYKLRKQLKDQFGQEFITTVRGVGYKIEVSNNN